MLTYTNPIYDRYFADPFVWRHEGTYYAIGTGRPEQRLALLGSRVHAGPVAR